MLRTSNLPVGSDMPVSRRSKAYTTAVQRPSHGIGDADLTAYSQSYAIAKRVLLKMIEGRHVPDKKELEANLFGDPIGTVLSPW